MSGRLEELWRTRPRSRLLRASALVLTALAVYSWTSGDLDLRGFFSSRRLENLERFLARDVVPFPLRAAPFDAGKLVDWAGGVLAEHGYDAALATLAIAILAIVLAAGVSWLGAPLAAATVATARPFERAPARGDFGWRLARIAARTVMILLRAVPEYILAFLLLAVLGPGSAWPAVLALGLHNGGILGRLGAETIENLDPGPLRALHAIGASRRTVLFTAVFPLALGRYLLYFFYRFETCVREATVLGMLGVVSLGYWIQDARARQYYDEMLLLVGVGALIVMASDLVSALARRYVRRGT